MHLTAVIPTWNEEAWLPRLFQSLRTSVGNCEIVVADNNSSDETRSLALRFGARIVEGGLPAAARNSGARAATGDTLLFLDADVLVPSATLHDALKALHRPGVVGVHARQYPLTSNRFIQACYWVMHRYLSALELIGYPQGVGSFIIVRRCAFNSIGGFAEDVSVGEDADFLRRLGQVGRVTYLNKPVLVSPRRFEIENRFLFAAKCVVWALLRLFGSSRSIIAYRWRRYPPSFAEEETAFCARALTRWHA